MTSYGYAISLGLSSNRLTSITNCPSFLDSLKLLQERLVERSGCALLWNEQFSTVVKQNGKLYILQNGLKFLHESAAWKELMIPKCDHSRCAMEFNCLFNLERHKFIHNASNNMDISEYRNQIGEYWDNLSLLHASSLLSLVGRRIMTVSGETLVQELHHSLDAADPRFRTLLDAIGGEKLSAKDLFSLLDEGSEGTLFSFDVRTINEDQLFEEGIEPAKCDFRTLLGYYSYMIEKTMVKSNFIV
jgi:hypothetical protein